MKETYWKLGAEILLPLAILLIWLAIYKDPEGAFEKVKEIGSSLKEVVSINLGAKEVKGEKPVIPLGQQQAITSLKKTMEGMKGESNCFANYGGLGVFAENGGSLAFQYDASAKVTTILIKGGVTGQQEVSIEKIDGIQPCVIAGQSESGARAQQFLQLLQGKPATDYYALVPEITIKGDNDDNSILYAGTESELHDQGWLFTPGSGIICFFPQGANDEKGLSKDFFSIQEKEGFSSLVGQGGAKLCSETSLIQVTYGEENLRLYYQGGWTYWDDTQKIWRVVNDEPDYLKHQELKDILQDLITSDEATGRAYFGHAELPNPWLRPKISGLAPGEVLPFPEIKLDTANKIAYTYNRRPFDRGWYFNYDGTQWQPVPRQAEDVWVSLPGGARVILNWEQFAPVYSLRHQSEEEGYAYLTSHISNRGSPKVEVDWS